MGRVVQSTKQRVPVAPQNEPRLVQQNLYLEIMQNLNCYFSGNKYVREIIPGCVVKLVRQLYPNPSGKGYEGEAPLFKIYDKEGTEIKKENGVLAKVD